MNKEQITFLMDAGYTIEEIMQMPRQQDPKPDPKPEPQPDPKPDPKPDPQLEPKPDPKTDPQPDPRIDQLTSAVSALTQLIQAQNIKGVPFGAPQPDRSVDDILAEIINPPQTTKK